MITSRRKPLKVKGAVLPAQGLRRVDASEVLAFKVINLRCEPGFQPGARRRAIYCFGQDGLAWLSSGGQREPNCGHSGLSE